jgi:hypothetical protein
MWAGGYHGIFYRAFEAAAAEPAKRMQKDRSRCVRR